jgi:ankyrin repeat protein
MTKRLQELRLHAESLLENNMILQAQPSSLTRNDGTLMFRPLESDIHAASNQGHLQGTSSHSSISTHRLDAESRLVRCFTTPLQQACFKGNTKLVNRLIKRGANVNAQSGRFCSAIHVAAYYGHVDTVTALLEAGANIDLEGGCFGTALQAAIAGDHDEVVDILLDHGADVNTSSAIAEPSDINENGPDYYNLPVKEMKRVTTD